MNVSHASAGYELRFRPLMAGGHDYRFPCDALGHVDMDSLSERARLNYFYARAVRGLEVERPDVQPCHAAGAQAGRCTASDSARLVPRSRHPFDRHSGSQ